MSIDIPSALAGGRTALQEALEERIRPLMTLSLKGLEKMRTPEGLFCFTIRDGEKGPQQEGVSLRYTAITLLGLHRAAERGWPISYDLDPMLESAVGAIPTTRNIGTLGLILWASAVMTSSVDRRVMDAIVSYGAFSQEKGNGVYATSELAWLLIGLLEASLVAPTYQSAGLIEQAHSVYQLLRKNFNPKSGLFSYSDQAPLRSRLGFFDGQVYGTYAFAQYARRFSHKQALEEASRCARTFCRLQGELGEWAWHYNKERGRVVERYPVYSVHQHGMAPLALRGLSEVSGEDFTPEIEKGLRWLFGENPLGFQFVDREESVIWRSMKRRPAAQKLIYFNKLSSFVAPTDWTERLNRPGLLTIDRECRPYELGWLLFAFADVAPKKDGPNG